MARVAELSMVKLKLSETERQRVQLEELLMGREFVRVKVKTQLYSGKPVNALFISDETATVRNLISQMGGAERD